MLHVISSFLVKLDTRTAVDAQQAMGCLCHSVVVSSQKNSLVPALKYPV
jgi:hypothetical protein